MAVAVTGALVCLVLACLMLARRVVELEARLQSLRRKVPAGDIEPATEAPASRFGRLYAEPESSMFSDLFALPGAKPAAAAMAFAVAALVTGVWFTPALPDRATAPDEILALRASLDSTNLRVQATGDSLRLMIQRTTSTAAASPGRAPEGGRRQRAEPVPQVIPAPAISLPVGAQP